MAFLELPFTADALTSHGTSKMALINLQPSCLTTNTDFELEMHVKGNTFFFLQGFAATPHSTAKPAAWAGQARAGPRSIGSQRATCRRVAPRVAPRVA